MNEIINPPCHSLLATFSELKFEVCQNRASSCLKTLVRPKRTLSRFFELLFPLPFLMSPKRKLLERQARRPEGSEGPNKVSGVCETEAGTEARVEDANEDLDVVGGVDEVGFSGHKSEGFTLSEILR